MAAANTMSAGYGIPTFDLNAGPGVGANASIDWQASAGDGWGVRLSPYAAAKADKAAPEFSHFPFQPSKGRGGGTAGGL